MGISWSPISVSEVLANKDAYNYFKDTNIEIPSSADNARFPPTPREIRMVLDSLESEGYETIYNIHENYWQAWISNRIPLGFEPQTTQELAEGIVNAMRSPQVQMVELNIIDFRTEEGEDIPYQFDFRKPDPELMILICERLSRICGSLILVSGAYADNPIFISPGIDPKEAIGAWEVMIEQSISTIFNLTQLRD